MRFCKVCERAMPRSIATGAVVFLCPCGAEERGDPMDARLGGRVFGAGETRDMYGFIIKTAPQDRTNQRVRRDCPSCGSDYMIQVRVGDAEVIVYVCECGYSPDAGAAPST